MEWSRQIGGLIIPWIVLVPLCLFVAALLAKVVARLRWHQQIVHETSVQLPRPMLIPIAVPQRLYANSILVQFPCSSKYFAGELEFSSGYDLIGQIRLPQMNPFIRRLKRGQRSIKMKVEKEISPGDLIARIDLQSNFEFSGPEAMLPTRFTHPTIRVSVFGRRI